MYPVGVVGCRFGAGFSAEPVSTCGRWLRLCIDFALWGPASKLLEFSEDPGWCCGGKKAGESGVPDTEPWIKRDTTSPLLPLPALRAWVEAELCTPSIEAGDWYRAGIAVVILILVVPVLYERVRCSRRSVMNLASTYCGCRPAALSLSSALRGRVFAGDWGAEFSRLRLADVPARLPGRLAARETAGEVMLLLLASSHPSSPLPISK